MASNTQKAAAQAPRNSHAKKKDPITVPEALAEKTLTHKDVKQIEEMFKKASFSPVIPVPFDWKKALEEEYGRVIRDRDLPGLLTAILTELVRNRRK